MRITVDRRIFNQAYRRHLEDMHRYQIYFGGAGSGKSVFLASRCVLDCLQGRNILVARQVARTLKSSCVNEIMKSMERLGVGDCFQYNRTDNAFTCRYNGAQILFAGLDDAEKLKSITPKKGVLTDIWLEEATECDYHGFKQLDKRLRGQSPFPKRFTLSFNPIDRDHWLYGEFFGIFPSDGRAAQDDRVSILKTTYRDNRYLTQEDVQALEGEKDPYYLRVYTYGDWGVREGVIFTDWESRALSGEEGGETRYGLDFGYAHDPCALVKVRYDKGKGTVYVLAEMKKTRLDHQALAREALEMAGKGCIMCDSAEPKSIQELRNLGVNAYAVKKGKDSVLHGIRWLQGKHLVVSTHCPEMRRELATYMWQQDREGKSLPIPRGGNDHLIDALRYALENDMSGRYIRLGSKRELGL